MNLIAIGKYALKTSREYQHESEKRLTEGDTAGAVEHAEAALLLYEAAAGLSRTIEEVLNG
jgi:hypothetical protein